MIAWLERIRSNFFLAIDLGSEILGTILQNSLQFTLSISLSYQNLPMTT